MKTIVLAGGAVVGGLVLYLLFQKKPGESFGEAAGREVVEGLGGVVTGAAGAIPGAVKNVGSAGLDAAADVVIGAGKLVGIPETNSDKCSADLAAGRTWEASFSCPAGRFIGSLYNSTSIGGAQRQDAEKVDSLSQYDAAGNYKPAWTGGATGTW